MTSPATWPDVFAHGLDNSFYGDWLSIAADEARHFLMLEKRLKDMGFAYGDFPPMMACGKPLMTHAMTLRPPCDCAMVLEARGLDVTPGMINRFEKPVTRRLSAFWKQFTKTKNLTWQPGLNGFTRLFV